jgi:hypothetical protein
MKRPLQRVTQEMIGNNLGLFYLYFDETLDVAETVSITPGGTVSIDLALGGEVVGVEVIGLGANEIQALSRIAGERNLSLDGFFDLASASPPTMKAS